MKLADLLDVVRSKNDAVPILAPDHYLTYLRPRADEGGP